jgi:hypothetical protein
MEVDFTRVRRCLREFDFKSLFIEELGWDQYAAKLDITVDGRDFILSAIAEKRGMVAFRCNALPDYKMRRNVEAQVAKFAHEHLIIFNGQARAWQAQIVSRTPLPP